MNNPVSPRFAAVFQAEVLFNLKRVAPYALMILFSANAFLWWGWGPAVSRGWAVNSDFYIVRLFGGFSFMTMPLFVALLMGDPVVRDFRVRIDPLIFSKPVSRAEYLSGKFFGNFFVLVCCQACFALTLLSLQAFSTEGMIVLSPRLLPYLQHFFFFVVVSSLLLGVVCFTVGTLTRNVKVVYGLAVSFYFLYVAWNVTIKGLPMRWRVVLDPLLFIFGAELNKGNTAEGLNRLAVTYDGYMIANRVLVLAASFVCLAILYSASRRASGPRRARVRVKSPSSISRPESRGSTASRSPRAPRLRLTRAKPPRQGGSRFRASGTSPRACARASDSSRRRWAWSSACCSQSAVSSSSPRS